MPKPSSPESRKPKTEQAVDFTRRPDGDHTAPSHSDNPTEAISVPQNGEEAEPTAGEQVPNNELTQEDREYIEKAIGSAALSSLTPEDIEAIKTNDKHGEMLQYLNKNKVGGRIESSPLLQKMVSDWLKFGVRAEELSDDSEYIQYEDDEESDDDTLAPAEKRKIAGPQAQAMVLKTNLEEGLRNRSTRSKTRREIRIAKRKADARAEFADDNEKLEKELAKIDKRENWRIRLRAAGIALGTTVSILGATYLYHKYGSTPSGGGNQPQPNGGGAGQQPGGGGGNQPPAPDQAPGAPKPPTELFPGTDIPIPKTPEEMRLFFESAPDPAHLTPDNDFNFPIANGNNPLQFKLDLAQQLRGNSHELASYLSVAKIPGAPLEADFPNNQAGYIQAINDYAIQLDKNPTEHFQQFTLLADKINGAEFNVRDVTFNYESTLIDQNGQFGIDPFVPANGTITEVIFNKGTPDEFSILVRNECGQTIKQLIEQHFAQPAPAPVDVAPTPRATYTAPAEYTPPTRAPQPAPAPTPAPQPQGHGGGGGHDNTPQSTWGKNTRADGSNLAQYGDAPRGSGALQNEQNVVRPSANYSPNAGNDNPGGLAPDASSSTGLYDGGQEAATPGLNGAPPSSPSGAESAGGSGAGSSSPGASENTSSASEAN